MEFVKEFTTFLYKTNSIAFGNYTLSSGKQSPYYIDLRKVPSHPFEFRLTINQLKQKISDTIGLDNIGGVVSVPTSGLVIASALATEIMVPLMYVRDKAKGYGNKNLVEGDIEKETSNLVLIDDVATSGMSMKNTVIALKEAGFVVKHAFVVVNRKEGASELLSKHRITLVHILDIADIVDELKKKRLVDNITADRIIGQIR